MTCTWQVWKNKYGIKDAYYYNPPGDGNCQFGGLSEAISPIYNFTPNQLRKISANGVRKMDDDYFNSVVMVTYNMEIKDDSFTGAWLPKLCKSREHLARAIEIPLHTRKPFDFQGDIITLGALANELDIDFILFNTRGFASYDLSADKKRRYTVFMIYENIAKIKHFQIIGVITGPESMQSIFYSDCLPEVFEDYLRKSGRIKSDAYPADAKSAYPAGVKNEAYPAGVKNEAYPAGVKNEAYPTGAKSEAYPTGVKNENSRTRAGDAKMGCEERKTRSSEVTPNQELDGINNSER